MHHDLALAIAVIAPLAVVALFNRRRRCVWSALAVTIAVTWGVATFAMSWLLPDPSDLSAFYFFFLIIVPCLSIPVAALVATSMSHVRGQLVSALLLALLGWIAGLVVAVLVDQLAISMQLPRYFWDYAFALAAPASYAATGAFSAACLARSS